MKRSHESPSSSNQHQNTTAGKNWQNRFNGLCSDLTSIIPPQYFQPSKDELSQADQIAQATNYVVELRERVDNLSKRNEQLQVMVNQEAGTSSSNGNTTWNDLTMMSSSRLPIIEVKEAGSDVEVQLVMETENSIQLHEVIRVLEEEGAVVVNATFSTSGSKVYYTLHAKALSSRIGVEVSRIYARLHGSL